LGGLSILIAVLALVGFIGKEVLPLLQGAHVSERVEIRFDDAGVGAAMSGALAAGVDEYMEYAFVLGQDGTIDVIDLEEGRLTKSVAPLVAEALHSGALPLAAADEAADLGQSKDTEAHRPKLTAARYIPWEGRVVHGAEDGWVGAIDVQFPVRFEGSRRVIDFVARSGERVLLDPQRRTIRDVAIAGSGDRATVAGITAESAVLLKTREVSRSMFGGGESIERLFDLTGDIRGRATALALSPDGRALLVGTDAGLLYQWSLQNPTSPQLVAEIVASGPEAGDLAYGGAVGTSAVTALTFLIGGQTVVVGDAGGGVSAWFEVRENDPAQGATTRRFHRIHVLQPHESAVRDIAPSQRNRTFVTLDELGVAAMHHSTSQQTFYSRPVGAGAISVVISPKSDGQLNLSDRGLTLWDVRNPHPEVSLRTLFAPIHYEGYRAPAHVWQSTGATDAFESKFSLVPLAFGTIKGTIYALIFALPLGVLGAVYTSQFMHPRLQSVVKPTIEIMAGLPSVVLGFLAGLWLAPILSKVLPGLLLMLVVIPALIVSAAFIWPKLPPRIRRNIPRGAEAVLLIPVVLAGAAGALALGPALEAWAMAGDVRYWLFDALGLGFEQRNSLVIGIVMGFAVIPVVFSVSEDALSSVPRSLSAGSLALGASRWQTALGVVVPAALPGILSAVLVSIGRAAGETMIVLMATGNTPVMSMNIFDGFRALSANIAVELPEAPVGGTLYRTLFVASLLLFAFTFCLNTIGEAVRLRMRKRLSRL